MQNTATQSDSKLKYYYPATKIRSLINNLDAELKRLSNQCDLTKVNNLIKPKTNPNWNQTQMYQSRGALLASSAPNNNNVSSSVHMHTLSSIYRARVIDAYRNRRIFTVYGNYYTIRRSLLRRGWLEKLPPNRYPKMQGLSQEVLLQNAKRGNEFEAVAISRIINNFPAFFVWQGKGMRDMYNDVHPHRNRVRRGRNLDFSTKVGLIGCAEQEHWFRQDGICRMIYPRVYRLGGNTEDRTAFIEDFRRTQCRSLIRYVWETMDKTDELVDMEQGTVELGILQFALDNLRDQLLNFDSDDVTPPNNESDAYDWQAFYSKSMDVIKNHAKFKGPLSDVLECARFGRILLDKIEEKRPDYKWDGCRNLWILKPGFSCRGYGIIIRSSLDDIMQWASNNQARRYIAQKYIERPLLIYKTKFDIRQYMLLVIGESTVSLWLYRDCYLRFSGQEYSITDLREAIHLTNNSVQKKYKAKPTRDQRLPRNNMWSLEQFKSYLRQCGAPEDIWHSRIFKGFRENLIAVVMASLEETQFVENAFELYGCDFMLDEQYNPILIEVNSTPDLSPSTDVTARICPIVLKDLIKVVVDRSTNNSADTGLFERIYEVNYKTAESFDPQVGLPVNGKTMTLFKQKSRRFIVNISRSLFSRSNKHAKEAKKIEEKNTPPHSDRSTTSNGVKKVAVVKKHKVSVKRIKIPKSPTPRPKGPAVQLKPFTKEALALRYTQPK